MSLKNARVRPNEWVEVQVTAIVTAATTMRDNRF